MTRPDPLRHLDGELAALERRGLLRAPGTAVSAPADAVVLCSNDYLGYASEAWPEVHVRSGAGASRLVSGNDAAHEEAERAVAAWLGAEAALLFSSGYAANVGVLSALAGRDDVIVSDALNHASIIDGCRLSGARVVVVPHADAGAVGEALAKAGGARRRWVVTEAYFSMDGDSPDLRRLRAVCDACDAALVVDEAHALGVFGPEGRGLCAALGVRPDVLVGTAGKALGLHGAFVVGSRQLRLWLWNRARSFVFSTGVVPGLAAAITARVRRARADEAGRTRLQVVGARVREGLLGLGVASAAGEGPIIPWIVGEAGEAVALSRRLRERGVVVQAIRQPTVPEGTARLRVTVNAGLRDEEIERALAAFRVAVQG
jgi:8-amino-7-oxononanoate synthase